VRQMLFASCGYILDRLWCEAHAVFIMRLRHTECAYYFGSALVWACAVSSCGCGTWSVRFGFYERRFIRLVGQGRVLGRTLNDKTSFFYDEIICCDFLVWGDWRTLDGIRVFDK
jgi:hypothetical protein